MKTEIESRTKNVAGDILDLVDELTYVTASMDYLENVVDHNLSSLIRIMRDRLEGTVQGFNELAKDQTILKEIEDYPCN